MSILNLYEFQMNLNMIRPKNDTEDLLLSKTKNFETFIQQTHTKPEETLEFKMIKPKERFHFKPPVEVKDDWMIGLTSLGNYNLIFKITEYFNKIKRYIFLDEKSGGVSYQKVRDEIERDLVISGITPADLQDEILAPLIIKEYRKQVTKRMEDGKYMLISVLYFDSIFEGFESFLRTEIDLVEDVIRLV